MTYLFLLLLALLLIGPRNLAKLMARGAKLYAQLKQTQAQLTRSLQEQIAGLQEPEASQPAALQISEPLEYEDGGAEKENSLSHAS